MIKVVAFIIIIAFAHGARGECPSVNDLPVYYNDNTFFCARFYYGLGNDLPLHGCNGCSTQQYGDVYEGMDSDAGAGLIYPLGSLIVRPGCTFYQFDNVYEGPAIYSKIENGPESGTAGCARPG
jgi:hypothetical protein